MRITFGNQLHDSYIHQNDAELIEKLAELQPIEKSKNPKLDYIQYVVSSAVVYPRYTEGYKIEYFFNVSSDGFITNQMNVMTSKSRVIHINTPRKRTDFDRVTIEQIDVKYNHFNLQRNSGIDEMYIKSKFRHYDFQFDNHGWKLEFNELYGNPSRYVDDTEYLYFLDKPKTQCTLYGPYNISLPTVKNLLAIILPTIYKIKN